MNQLFENFFKLFLILLGSLNCINCEKLTVEVNPGCPQECKQYGHPVNLVHIHSKGGQSNVHYLWSSITCIPPTLLIVETEKESTLTVDWTQLLDGIDKDCSQPKDLKDAIKFSGTVVNSIGFQFTKLFFFNDVHKKGEYDGNNETQTIDVDWNHLFWKAVDKPSDSDSIKLSFTNTKETIELYNGSLSFDLRVDSSDGRNEELPHLAYTKKSVSLEFSLNKVETDTKFGKTNRPRLMAEIYVMMGGKASKPKTKFDRIDSIDDEYTPGVFRRIVLDLKNNENKAKNSFLSWKPIAYDSDERIIANTLDVVHTDPTLFNLSQSNNSRIFKAFFDEKNDQAHTFNLTFGAPDDDTYYADDKVYNTFALVVGVDSAPDEELSLLVKIIIVVGFGLPLLVMVVSAMYIIVRKIRKRKSNDLLLNQSQQTLND